MEELRGSVSPGNLFSPGGSNGDFFTNMWQEATKCSGAVDGRLVWGHSVSGKYLYRYFELFQSCLFSGN